MVASGLSPFHPPSVVGLPLIISLVQTPTWLAVRYFRGVVGYYWNGVSHLSSGGYLSRIGCLNGRCKAVADLQVMTNLSAGYGAMAAPGFAAICWSGGDTLCGIYSMQIFDLA